MISKVYFTLSNLLIEQITPLIRIFKEDNTNQYSEDYYNLFNNILCH